MLEDDIRGSSAECAHIVIEDIVVTRRRIFESILFTYVVSPGDVIVCESEMSTHFI